MNASRSRRELTCEISISGTSANGDLGRILPPHRDFQQRFSHVFLADNQIDEQHIKRDEFEPEVPNRLTDEQDGKQNKHPIPSAIGSSQNKDTPCGSNPPRPPAMRD